MINLQAKQCFLISISVYCFLLLIVTQTIAASGDGMLADESMNTAIEKIESNNAVEYRITDGTTDTTMKNLFHGFTEFNIEENESAHFVHQQSIENIITRVTGSTSWINGKLSTSGNANFFLLNPNGIILGKHAEIDIQGSFYCTTADFIEFGDNERFYAHQSNPMLSIASPVAFGFIDDNIGGIQYKDGNDTEKQLLTNTDNNQSISFIGGDIIIDNSTLAVDHSLINIAGINSSGTLSIINNDMENQDVSSFTHLGNVTLTNNSLLSAHNAGMVLINADTFEMNSSSLIEIENTNGRSGGKVDIHASNAYFTNEARIENWLISTSENCKGADVFLTIKNDLIFSNESKIFSIKSTDYFSTPYFAREASSGNVTINASSIQFDNFSEINTSADYGGKSGDISIKANNSVLFTENSSIKSDGVNSMAGNVSIVSKKISFVNGSGIQNTICINDDYPTEYLSDLSDNIGGNIDINGDIIEFYGNTTQSASNIHTSISGEFINDVRAGNIVIHAKRISFLDGGALYADSESGSGHGGAINIFATASITLKGFNPNAQYSYESTSAMTSRALETDMENAGNAGEIYIETPHLTLSDKAEISVSSNGPGNAGNITLKVNELEIFSDASITSSSNSTGIGGDAGSIEIISTDAITLSSNAFISTETKGTGNAGAINLLAKTIVMDNQAYISSKSIRDKMDSGNAGTIKIETTDSIHILNGSELLSYANFSGNNGFSNINGNITLNAPNVIYLSHSIIKSDITSFSGLGGNIDIDPIFFIHNEGQLIGRAYEKSGENTSQGKGGNISINADYIINSNSIYYSNYAINMKSSNKYSMFTPSDFKENSFAFQNGLEDFKTDNAESLINSDSLDKDRKKKMN